MTESLEDLQERVATLEAERERLTAAAPKKLMKRQLKDRRDVSSDLAIEQRRVATREARLARLRSAESAEGDTTLERRRAGQFLTDGGVTWLLFFGAGALIAPVMLTVRDLRWVETTCATRTSVDAAGEEYRVATPALRPNWRSNAGCSGRCWVMDPETSERVVSCDAPTSTKVSWVEQVSLPKRLLVATGLWFAIAGVLRGIRSRSR